MASGRPYIEVLLWPALAALLSTTFVQVPLLHVRDAFRDRRFVLASLLGNFVLIPLGVWLILPWLPDDPALQQGVLLVLLVPCTDWFITFTQLGQGMSCYVIVMHALLPYIKETTMAVIAKITAKGQTTVPAVIRAALQVGKGDLLAWEVLEDGEVRVRRVQPLDLEYLKAIEGTLSEWASAADEEAYRDL